MNISGFLADKEILGICWSYIYLRTITGVTKRVEDYKVINLPF